MTRNNIINNYYEYLLNWVITPKYHKYSKLLMYLHTVDFRWCIEMDANRASDGEDLRYRFSVDNDLGDISDILTGECSVLEMMVALAIRCEETIMDDPDIGDRTAQWFWEMIYSLGLRGMTDSRFDKKIVEERIDNFLDREYQSNGVGGLFTIKYTEVDLRTVEIWYQMLWYLDTIE